MLPKFRFPRIDTPLVLALLSAGLTLLMMQGGILESQEYFTFDWRCQWTPERLPGDDIFLLLIDEGTLKTEVLGFGTFPWPRDVWAILQSEFIDPLQPHSIAYDIVFDQPDTRSGRIEDSDRVFAQAIRNSGNVFMAFSLLVPSSTPLSATEMQDYDKDWAPPSPNFVRRFALDKNKVQGTHFWHGTNILRPLAEFESAVKGIGTTNTPPDDDRITRRFPLVVEYSGEYYPSLPLALVCDYLDVDLKKVRVRKGEVILPVDSGKPLRIRVDERCCLLLDYYGPKVDIFPNVTMKPLLQSFLTEEEDLRKRIRPERMKDKILLIGSIAMMTHDLRGVTVAELYPQVGNVATAMANILNQHFFFETHWLIDSLILVLLAILLVELTEHFGRLAHPLLERLPKGVFGLGSQLAVYLIPTAALGGAYGYAAYYLQSRLSVIIPMFYGFLCIVLTYAMITLHRFISEERSRIWFEQTWGRYMSPDMIRQLRDNPEQVNIGGEEREMTLLFSDIVGFTPLSETMTPAQLVENLNEYFEEMVSVVDENRGMLDKFIGDAIMLHFGSPQPAPDDALRAVRTGLAMQQRMTQINERWEEKGRMPWQMRIGINTGTVVVGNIGSQRRQEYTAIGDTVNTAQRLEANCPPGGVLISRSTYEKVKDHVVAKPLEPIRLKGKRELVEVFLVKEMVAGN